MLAAAALIYLVRKRGDVRSAQREPACRPPATPEAGRRASCPRGRRVAAIASGDVSALPIDRIVNRDGRSQRRHRRPVERAQRDSIAPKRCLNASTSPPSSTKYGRLPIDCRCSTARSSQRGSSTSYRSVSRPRVEPQRAAVLHAQDHGVRLGVVGHEPRHVDIAALAASEIERALDRRRCARRATPAIAATAAITNGYDRPQPASRDGVERGGRQQHHHRPHRQQKPQIPPDVERPVEQVREQRRRRSSRRAAAARMRNPRRRKQARRDEIQRRERHDRRLGARSSTIAY